ncbi:MAG: 3-hexulose-6-phosphate synthase [Caldilineaceae bacterium]
MPPVLQLALDDLDLDRACALALQLEEYFGLLEAGTPLIKRYGMEAVCHLRQTVPHKPLVADMKTMDAGALEANLAFDAGANIMTVLGCASNTTIQAALDVALQRQQSIAVDLVNVADKTTRARELAQMGVHFIAVHTASDDQRQGRTPLADLTEVRAAVDCQLMVAGGITPQSLPALLLHKPNILIVGSFVTKAADPLAAAQQLHALIQQSV